MYCINRVMCDSDVINIIVICKCVIFIFILKSIIIPIICFTYYVYSFTHHNSYIRIHSSLSKFLFDLNIIGLHYKFGLSSNEFFSLPN